MLGSRIYHRTYGYTVLTFFQILIFSLPLGIVLVLLGSDSLDDPCLATSPASSPNLVQWMIAEGSFLLGLSCLLFLFAPWLILRAPRLTKFGRVVNLAFYPTMIFFQIWHLIWLFIGAQRTGQDQWNCIAISTIYRCNAAALIIGFVGNFITFQLAC
jgi:hypothetical protein